MERDLEEFRLIVRPIQDDFKRSWPTSWQMCSVTVVLWRGHKSVSKPECTAPENREKERERDWTLPTEESEGRDEGRGNLGERAGMTIRLISPQLLMRFPIRDGGSLVG